jgi:hypothetical protein
MRDRKELFGIILASFMVMIYAILLIGLIFIPIPQENKHQLIHLCGILEGCIIMTFSFYFNSNNKKEKEEEK